jgi:5'-nucleotidase
VRIVLTNDDGIDAPGIEALEAVLLEIRPDAELLVIAPDGPRSGIGHALAHAGDHIETDERGVDRIAISGTPADCARLALARGGPLWPIAHGSPPRPVDWLIAGINHGANLGTDTFVSGTAAAAREAALQGTPAIAISQYQARHRHIDWKATAARARRVLDHLLDRPPAVPAFWNVNLPHPPDEAVDPGWTTCPIDPSPLPVEFEVNARGYLNRADYHGRARLAGADVDVCLGGLIAISEIRPA